MSFWSRILLFFRVKGRAALGRAEDPREVMGYVEEQQQELLRRVKQGLIEVAISKRQLQQQLEALEARVPRVEDQARRALAAGREDLARLALDRKQQALAELRNLEGQVEQIGAEERRFTLAERQLAARIEEFRVYRRTLAARYTAAEAQVRVTEALSGVTQDFAELGMAVGRAEEKIDRMLAHASAIGALVEGDPWTLPAVRLGDVVERELDGLARGHAVEQELATLLAELEPRCPLESSDTWRP